ncbi:hypothetical protein [Metabacillus sp. Hm71]|uniref:hypothetical protein n=1 Tax=Metabacillus sp. Hm71 TaxID=3450743 RepID=UPI003F443990
MTNHEKVLEIRAQINQWAKEMDNLEDMIEEAYHRIDELSVSEQVAKEQSSVYNT